MSKRLLIHARPWAERGFTLFAHAEVIEEDLLTSPMDSGKQPHADTNEGLMFATETQNFISLYFSLISVNNNNNNKRKNVKGLGFQDFSWYFKIEFIDAVWKVNMD